MTHITTPLRTTSITPYFGISPLAKYAPKTNDEYAEMIKTGNILIDSVIIEPKEFASLVEVYIHIFCFKHDELPPLNKRIG